MSKIITVEGFGSEYVFENGVWMSRPVTEDNSEDWDEVDFDVYSDMELDVLKENGIKRT